MRSLIEIRDERPPHRILADVDAFRVDRLLTTTGRGAFAFNLPNVGIDRDLLREGRMVVIKSTVGIPAYVGVITQQEEDTAAGVVEVSGDNYASIAYNLALNRTAPVSNVDAGTLARRALAQAQGGGRSIFLEAGVCIGTPLRLAGGSINFGSQLFGAALDALAARVGDQWWIEHDVTRARVRSYLYWNRRRGVDLAGSVYLEEGRDFIVGAYKRDGLGFVRTAIAIGGGGPIDGRPSAAVGDIGSGLTARADRVEQELTDPADVAGPLIARDLVELRAVDDDVTVLAQAARRARERPTTARETLALTSTLTAAAQFNPGDTVTARFHSVNYGGLIRPIRINAMQPDEASGECDLDVSVGM